jgi:hypothetical protein
MPLALDQVKAKLYPPRGTPTSELVASLDTWASKTHPDGGALRFWTPGYRHGGASILHNDHTPASLAAKRGHACALCGMEFGGPRRSAMDWRAMGRQESNAAQAEIDRQWSVHLCNMVASNPISYGCREEA